MNKPLVTIAIIAYNSAEFILEALEHARLQTYERIELIIADDASKDETVSISRNWLAQHADRFVKTQLLTAASNSGTSANLNRAIRASSGEWMKFIAGDDYLLPHCIETFVTEINAKPEIEFLFGNLAVNGTETISKELLHFFSLDSSKQYKLLLKNSILPAPAAFIKRTVLEKTHSFEECYRLFEDYPFFLNVLSSGTRFYHLNKAVVYYRVHDTNISLEPRINFIYYNDVKLFYERFYLKELRKQAMYLHYIHYLLEYALLWLISKRMITSYRLYNTIRNWISPLYWQLRIQKRLSF